MWVPAFLVGARCEFQRDPIGIEFVPMGSHGDPAVRAGVRGDSETAQNRGI